MNNDTPKNKSLTAVLDLKLRPLLLLPSEEVLAKRLRHRKIALLLTVGRTAPKGLFSLDDQGRLALPLVFPAPFGLSREEACEEMVSEQGFGEIRYLREATVLSGEDFVLHVFTAELKESPTGSLDRPLVLLDAAELAGLKKRFEPDPVLARLLNTLTHPLFSAQLMKAER